MRPVTVDLSIVIVNWNSASFLEPCLKSIARQAESLVVETIVVDNASYDGSREVVAGMQSYLPSIIFVQNERNAGFAAANNLGYARSSGDHILFLNPDTELREHAVSRLIDVLNTHPDAGAAAPMLLNTDGTLQTSCVQSYPSILNQVADSEVLRQWFPGSALWGMRPLYSEEEGPIEAEVLAGASLMVRKSVFEEVGGFCEDYFMYAEDVDLCRRIRLAGYRNYYEKSAVVVHHGGGSTLRREVSALSLAMRRESIWLFFRKTRGAAYASVYRAAMAIAALVRLMLICSLGRVMPIARSKGTSSSVTKWRTVLKWTLGRHEDVKALMRSRAVDYGQ